MMKYHKDQVIDIESDEEGDSSDSIVHESDEIEKDLRLKEITAAKNHNMTDLYSFSII